MNSESDNKLSEVKQLARENLNIAAKVTPCVMVTEANWKALLLAVKSLTDISEHTVTNEEMLNYLNQLNKIFTTETEWLQQKQESISKDMEEKSKEMLEMLESQAGKQSEQYASELENSRKQLEKDIQTHTEKLYHRFLLPCLLLTFLSAVLILLQIFPQ